MLLGDRQWIVTQLHRKTKITRIVLKKKSCSCLSNFFRAINHSNPPTLWCLLKEGSRAKATRLEHVVPLYDYGRIPAPRTRLGAPRGRHCLGLDDKQGIGTTEGLVADANAVQVLLNCGLRLER